MQVDPSSRLVLGGVVDASRLATSLSGQGWARWSIVDGPLTTGQVRPITTPQPSGR